MRSSWLLFGIVGCGAAAVPAREPLRWRPSASVALRECPSTLHVKDLAAARDRCEKDDVTACLGLLERRELDYTASTSGTGLGCELSYTSILLGEFNDAEGRWPIHVTDLGGDGLPDLIKGESTSNPCLTSEDRWP